MINMIQPAKQYQATLNSSSVKYSYLPRQAFRATEILINVIGGING
tara:strand:+ start:705 stop:842 length:138 start_codon:yes stop_codon:yes gene_type:complete